MFKKALLTTFVAALALAGSATAAVVTPVIAYGHNNRDNFGGNIDDVWNGSGMNGVQYSADQVSWPPATDPSTWTKEGAQYRDEWQADQLLDNNTSINGKVGWIIMDLGAEYLVNTMYLWNGVQIGTNALKDFNIYAATAPVVPGTKGPTGGGDADDYDFGAGGWAAIGGTQTLSDGGGGGSADGVYALGGVAARYIALEMMSRHNGNFDPNSGRIGFAEAGFTADPIPEPGSLALLGLGGLLMVRRRRA